MMQKTCTQKSTSFFNNMLESKSLCAVQEYWDCEVLLLSTGTKYLHYNNAQYTDMSNQDKHGHAVRSQSRLMC